jgi:hypothetical protein
LYWPRTKAGTEDWSMIPKTCVSCDFVKGFRVSHAV